MAGLGSRKLKLLLITAGCDRNAIGEAQTSFQWASRLGQRHDVTLLNYRNTKKPPTEGQLPGIRVIEWPDFSLFETNERFNAMLKPGYVPFYIRARQWIRSYLKSGKTFDLIHQIAPLALRYPSPAAGVGVPLIIGPLGGSLDNPPAFRGEMSKVPWYTKLRALDEWRLRHDPLLRKSYASANPLICVAPYVKSLLGDLVSGQVEYMTETGVVQLPPPHVSTEECQGQLRLLFVGRVIRSKGVRDAVRAIAKLKDLKGVRFEVVGDGEDLGSCKEEACQLGIEDKVIFHGRVPRSEVDAFYAKADVFLFPSFREPSGNAVIEAMSHGLALIVADRGGPGFVVDDSCGIRVQATEPEQFSLQIAAAVRKLAFEPDSVATMGAAAREKVRSQFLWEVKVNLLQGIYDKVLNAHEGNSP